MRIYLDCSCLQRPLDRIDSDRIRRESETVTRLLDLIADGRLILVSSNALEVEIARNPDPIKRAIAQSLLTMASTCVPTAMPEVSRGRVLEALGFKRMDALHLACAESGGADVFLTTDDRLLPRAARCGTVLSVLVTNPSEWKPGGSEPV